MFTCPKIIRNNNSIEIIVSSCHEYATCLDIELILDLNQFQDVIGIEILNLKMEAGEFCLEQLIKLVRSEKNSPRYSYDEESDSFYLRITDERSFDQKAVGGALMLNKKGQIVGFKAEFNE